MGTLFLHFGLAVGDKRIVGQNFEPKLVHSLCGGANHEFPLVLVPASREARESQLCSRAVKRLAVL
ncbi:hypothetical protein AZSI13_34120 [Azospira sp. I13]|nr:hypothetical protein AZSI13_34120 [Azospira sp. I13]